MPQRWGFEPFSRGTQWVIVMRHAQEGRAAAWQPELCRAFLEVDGKTAVGYVGDLSTRERVMLEVLAARAAPSRAAVGAPTRSR